MNTLKQDTNKSNRHKMQPVYNISRQTNSGLLNRKTYSNVRLHSVNHLQLHTDILGQCAPVRPLSFGSCTGEPPVAYKQKRCPTDCVDDFYFSKVPLARRKTQTSNILEAMKKEGKGIHHTSGFVRPLLSCMIFALKISPRGGKRNSKTSSLPRSNLSV